MIDHWKARARLIKHPIGCFDRSDDFSLGAQFGRSDNVTVIGGQVVVIPR